MFFCIGENQIESCSVGQGETLAQAIKDWAYTSMWHEILEEFHSYNPAVIEGIALDLEIEFPEPNITIVK